MNLALWTWLSIGVLLVGPLAVFAWFIGEALRLVRSMDTADRDEAATNQGPAGS